MTAPGSSLPPSIAIGEFTGPLDLLLDEVRRQNVAIENIAMAPIVARYLDYVQAAGERNVNLDIEWLHMAATLILWKSRALLPQDASQDPQKDPIRDDLIQQLLAHRKQAADELARRRAVEETRISRSAIPDGSPESPAEAEDTGFVSVWDLIQEARDLARWVEQHRAERRRWRESSFGVERDDTTVSDMMEYLRNQLAIRNGRLDGVDLLESQATSFRRSCLFLGMLEMVHVQEIQLQQDQTFGAIVVESSELRNR